MKKISYTRLILIFKRSIENSLNEIVSDDIFLEVFIKIRHEAYTYSFYTNINSNI